MKNTFAQAFAIGLALVAVAVGVILYMQRGAHLDLPGSIKVRTISTSKDDSLVLVDLHVTNPADYSFMVSNVTVKVETPAGDKSNQMISRVDAERFFAAMPEKGPFHPPLYTKALIPAHSTSDYTIAVQFNVPESMLTDRKRLVLKVDEINGKSFEYSEK